MTQLITERYQRKGLHFIEELGNGVQLEMVLIKGGTFLMGTPDEEIERLVKKFDDEEYFRREAPQHQVTVPNFFMGRYQVTQKQWKAVAELPQVEKKLESEPSYFKDDNNLPVECISWYDAVEFCARLSNHTGRRYSLPTEAEWEYACRAGTTTPFHFGETISGDLANYRASSTYANEAKGEYREKTTPVGQFPPNAFGLYDMHGNLDEWCLDDYHDNYEGAPTDGSAWFDKENDNLSQKQGRGVLRGGSWPFNPQICRSASRNGSDTRDNDNNGIGFRVVCAVGRTS
ncbi:MAG: formylglycine-generating enzyme family protein [Rivularia sp. (in: cyanobacteria)]